MVVFLIFEIYVKENNLASDIFLDLGTVIKGESKDAVYSRKIDILDWEWEMSQTATFHTGGGGGSGKVNIDNLSVTKNVDTSTPNLMLYCAKDNHFSEGKLVVRKAGGEQIEYLVIKMEKILVSKYSVYASTEEKFFVEKVELNFAKVSVEYVAQKDDGTGEATISFGWNIEKNIEA